MAQIRVRQCGRAGDRNHGRASTRTRVVHVLHAPCDVYVGRANGRYHLPASPFANHLNIGRDGTREEVIAKYRAWLLARPDLLAQVPALRGQVLGCWCKQLVVDVPCHGDVLAEMADSFGD